MGKTLTILVIEDDSHHLADAKKFFSTKQGVSVSYATTYEEAAGILYKDSLFRDGLRDNLGIRGIISDVYFPDDPYHPTECPLGVRIAVEMQKLNIPLVLNTAGYHHGSKYQWIHRMSMEHRWPLVDISPESESQEVEATSKNWKEAFRLLNELIKKTKHK